MMENPMVKIRAARESDSAAIKKLIHTVGINPMGLDWHHFILAVDARDEMIGCGQIKPHGDGSRELASLAVVESQRGRGIARTIIQELMADNPPPLYLTCRDNLESLYLRFGFRVLAAAEMTPYFKRLSRLAGIISGLAGGRVRMLVMKWDG